MEVSDAMARTFSSASSQDTIQKVAELMVRENCGFIPIVENSQVRGVITDRDIVINCLGQRHDDLMEETAEHIMTTGVKTVAPDDSIEEAAHRMAQYQVRRLPVVDHGQLVGVLSHGNLVQALRGQGAAVEATLGVTTGA
jgi:CBS domain-containing protein